MDNNQAMKFPHNQSEGINIGEGATGIQTSLIPNHMSLKANQIKSPSSNIGIPRANKAHSSGNSVQNSSDKRSLTEIRQHNQLVHKQSVVFDFTSIPKQVAAQIQNNNQPTPKQLQHKKVPVVSGSDNKQFMLSLSHNIINAYNGMINSGGISQNEVNGRSNSSIGIANP